MRAPEILVSALLFGALALGGCTSGEIGARGKAGGAAAQGSPGSEPDGTAAPGFTFTMA